MPGKSEGPKAGEYRGVATIVSYYCCGSGCRTKVTILRRTKQQCSPRASSPRDQLIPYHTTTQASQRPASVPHRTAPHSIGSRTSVSAPQHRSPSTLPYRPAKRSRHHTRLPSCMLEPLERARARAAMHADGDRTQRALNRGPLIAPSFPESYSRLALRSNCPYEEHVARIPREGGVGMWQSALCVCVVMPLLEHSLGVGSCGMHGFWRRKPSEALFGKRKTSAPRIFWRRVGEL